MNAIDFSLTSSAIMDVLHSFTHGHFCEVFRVLLAVFKERIMPSLFALGYLAVHYHSDFLRRIPMAILRKASFIRLSAGAIVLSFFPHLFHGKRAHLTC